ncbi:MAG: efflux RND transporter periplasmic adaptor subunit [Holophagales bacterium]|jgi:cobalt-zinc-cadmium efflux system membrane fusion protein|nr:efflux RND transporter periplasmic adaptor subunit [Holophagales bacterium]
MTREMAYPLRHGLLLAGFLASVGAGLATGCARPASPVPAKTGTPEATVAEVAAAAKSSDLDRPVADLKAAVCEHRIPQYTCDGCRYEVGVVRAEADLFDRAKGGTLELAKASPRPLADNRDLTGEVRLNEERAVFLSPRAPGVVHAIRVDLGARVAAGQVLFEVESPDFRQAKADLARAAAAVGLAEATAARERELFEKRICPEKDLLEAEAARTGARADERAVKGRLLGLGLEPGEIEALATRPARPESGLLPVRAPFAGTILERSLSLGAQALPGDKLVLLADTSRVWVLTTIHEREVAAVLEAKARGPVEADVTVPAYPGRTFRGRIDHVGGTLDETTRTAKARVVVENPGDLLRSGMFARVRLRVRCEGGPLAVPSEAVLEDEGRSFVFVRLEGPYFVRRPVTVEHSEGGFVEVTGSLAAGDEVVSRGSFLLKSDVLRSKMGAGCAD